MHHRDSLQFLLALPLAALLAGCGSDGDGKGGAGSAGGTAGMGGAGTGGGGADAGGAGMGAGGAGTGAGGAGTGAGGAATGAGGAGAGGAGGAGTGAGGAGAGAGAGGAGMGSARTNVPGRHDHTLRVEQLDREAIVYVPMRAAGTTPVPVVFMLHGTSGDGARFFDISRWREKADAEGFLAVFPSALTHCFKEDENRDGDFADPGERKVTTKWASGNLGDPAVMPLCTAEELAMLGPAMRAAADHPLADDVAFTRALLELLGADYAVDPRRIYVSGFSNGAQMSSRLAVELADRFAAAAAAAGGMAIDPRPASRPMTFVFSVGNVDDRFTPATGGTPIPLEESVFMQYPIFLRLVTPYLTAFQLAETYEYDRPTVAGRLVSRFTYRTSTAGAQNRLVVAFIENLAHAYPNGTNHPMVAADVLWEVFRTEALP